MADDNKQTKITVSADVDPAKASLNDLLRLVGSVKRNIDKAFNTLQNNNGQLSNRQLASAQNGLGRLNDIKDTLQYELDSARATQTGSQLSETQQNINPKIDAITKAIERLSNNNQGKLNAINNARTTSSRAFRSSTIYEPGSNGQFGHDTNFEALNYDFQSKAKTSRSDIHNWNNSLRREANNLNQGINTGYISYNRYQQYQANLRHSKQRYDNFNKQVFGDNGQYSDFRDRFQQVKSEAANANKIASGKGATPANVSWARALDEQVKQMEKVNQRYQEQQEELKRGKEALDQFEKSLNNASSDDSKVNIGEDPNSFWGAISQRKFSIGRGALAAGMGSLTSAVSNGSNLRLASFDNIKSTMYANGTNDRHVLNSLGNAGYSLGYSGADMGQFAGAYTGSTGNVGNVKQVSNAAKTWAEQSRFTGGNQQSTLALEQTAGNSANLNASQMSSVGNAITNAITSSGMSAKASEQQQGLAMLYQNAAPYGMNATDEKNLVGMQASLSKYGPQFQGTLGAQTMTQLTQGLGNYNNPGMRQLFANGNPRYTGIDGSARLMEDMQNMRKNPKAMGRMLSSAENSFGGDRLKAASYLSTQTNIPVDTLKKLMSANDNGALKQSTMNKYLEDSSQAKKNKQGYDNSGASGVQKYNAALADSAMKASQALDLFRGVLANAYKSGGMLSPLASGIGSAVGAGASTILGNYLGGRILGRFGYHGKHGAGGSGSSIRDISGGLKDDKGGGGPKDEKGGRHAARGTGSRLGRLRDVAGKAVSKSREFLGRGASFVKGAGKLGKVGRFAMRGARALGRDTDVGDILFGGLDLYDAFSSTKKGTTARHRAVGSSIGNTAGGILGGIAAGAAAGSAFGGVGAIPGSIIGGIVGGFGGSKLGGAIGGMFGNTKKARATNKAKSESLSEARKTAGKYNSSRGLFHSKFAKYGLIGAGLGLAGLGLSDYFGNKAHASSRSNKDTRESWKILRGYNKMLDHAMRVVQAAKSIKNGGDDSKSDDDSDISGTSGKGEEAIKSVAEKMAKKFSLPAAYFQAQMDFESAHGQSPLATQDNNYGGIKYAGQSGAEAGPSAPDGGVYAHYDKLDDFANDYARILQADDIHSGMSIDDFIGALKSHGYMGTDEGTYLSAVKSLMGHATGGIRYHATGGPLITDTATTNNGTDVYGEAGTEAYVPLNAGHYQDGLSTVQQLAGMFGKQLVDQSQIGSNKSTTINPSYNINLTIQGGTDDAQSLAQTVADRVRQMLEQYDNQQQVQNKQVFYGNEASGLFV